MKKTIKYFFEATIIYIFFILAKILGLSLSRVFFSFVFKKIGPFIKSNKISKKNLLQFSNRLDNKKINKILSDMWANYGMTFIEYIFLRKFRNENLHIEIKGGEKLDDIRKNNKPVIFVSGHFANFELMSMEITKREIKLATIYRPLNNYFLNPFMEYLRRKFVCKNQIKKGRLGVKNAIEFIKRNHSIALMIDQRVSEGNKINFFNKDAYTTTLPAQLAIRYNLKIVPIFIKRDKNNFFQMEVYDPIDIASFKDKIVLTNKLNQILEKMIIKNPGQWIWTHDRWK